MLDNKSVNCYSFSCQRAGTIDGVPGATCTCPIGETFDGTSVPADTAFLTQAGQCSVNDCSQYPVSDPIGFDDFTQSGQCFQWPPLNDMSSKFSDKSVGAVFQGGIAEKASSGTSP